MKLLTAALERRFAQIGSQETKSHPLVIAKYFTPWSHWTWYATEYDPETRIFYGFVTGHFTEWGSFSLDELESLQGPLGLRIERDFSYDDEAKPINEISALREVL